MRHCVLTFAAVVLACDDNRSGNLAAPALGDTAHPAERGAAEAELIGACGAGALTSAGRDEIDRLPYLQRVTATGGRVLLTTFGKDPLVVDVFEPGRAPAATVLAGLDPVASAPGTFQRVAVLDGLEPATIYCMRLRGPAGELAGPTGFRTAPAPGGATRFIAFGDSGSGSADQWALAEQLATVPFDLIVHTGDVAYETGTLAQLDERFFQVYAPLLRHFPSYPVAGNHDHATEDGAPFRAVFDLPGDERSYSLDWGVVHFVALDSEDLGDAQAAWLDADLAATRQPWRVVYLHRPPYSSGSHGSNLQARALLAPVFARHGVVLALSGHDHDYERTVPIDGVTYVVTGGGGRGTRPVGSSAFTAFSAEVIHFVYVTVDAERLTLHAIDATGVEFDSVVIERAPVPGFPQPGRASTTP